MIRDRIATVASGAEMIFSCIRYFLMGSGGIFWALIIAAFGVEVRMRLWMRRNKDELDPDFGRK